MAKTVAKTPVKIYEEKYLGGADWEIKENANRNLSYSNFRNYLFEKLMKTPAVLSEYLPSEAVEAHFRGDIHIHKLPDSLWIPYCSGWSFEKLLKTGLKTPTVSSKPARHLDTAVAHITNFFFIVAQEWTGAQAVSAFDLYVAPFIAHDGLKYREVKQILQGMLFELNYPARSGYQSPFTNITLFLDTLKSPLEADAIVEGKSFGKLGDYIEDAFTVVKALLELYREGDALGRPFPFPIPTITITRDFDWSGRRWGELSDLLFEVLAEKGTAYILNGYATNVEGLYAMCCRLTLDVNHAVNHASCRLLSESSLTRAYGSWCMPDGTGSIGFITINLPRLAALSKGEWSRFEQLLVGKLEKAREVFHVWRKRYEKNLELGLMPATATYLGHFAFHFNTFALIGLPEAAANFMRDPLLWLEGSSRSMNEAIEIEKKMVALVRKYAEECEEEDGYLYNVEEVPGESAGYRLAELDAKLFKEELKKEEVFIPSDGTAHFYSNSIVPYYADVPLFTRLKWEGKVQKEFTGGVMAHIFLGEAADPEALKKLARRIVENTGVVYFSFTPALSFCTKCSWKAVGVFWECPNCGADTDVWSRIVGYYRPLRCWNPGRKADFRTRKHYLIS